MTQEVESMGSGRKISYKRKMVEALKMNKVNVGIIASN